MGRRLWLKLADLAVQLRPPISWQLWCLVARILRSLTAKFPQSLCWVLTVFIVQGSAVHKVKPETNNNSCVSWYRLFFCAWVTGSQHFFLHWHSWANIQRRVVGPSSCHLNREPKSLSLPPSLPPSLARSLSLSLSLSLS